MFFSLLYEICLMLLALAYFPVLLYQMIFKGKYRQSLSKRFGSGFPIIEKGERPLVWIHAVSLGETKAVSALVKTLKAEFNNPVLVFSTTTQTGYAEACRTIVADYHVYLPFDFGWVIKPIIQRTAPDLVLLCESDFWYNFLSASKKAGAIVAVVNGKLSTRSLQRFLKLSFFTKRLFACIDLFCVQSNLYRKRFAELGIPQEKLAVTGNIKFDGDYAKLPATQIAAWKLELGIKENDPVLVIGSTHYPEELQMLKMLPQVWKVVPALKVMIVPRHPERFNEVAALLQKSDVNFRRLSEKNGSMNSAPVILIDAMGLLCKCYQLADIAVVAGSYTPKVGGHNILEPCWYGVPVLFGPHMHSQPDLVDLVREYEAGLQVAIEELPNMLLRLLQDKSYCNALGDGGLRLTGDVHGATAKTLVLLKLKIQQIKNSPLLTS